MFIEPRSVETLFAPEERAIRLADSTLRSNRSQGNKPVRNEEQFQPWTTTEKPGLCFLRALGGAPV
jgi:hypothetical protein